MLNVEFIPLEESPTILPFLLLIILIAGVIGIMLVTYKGIRFFIDLKKELKSINEKLDKNNS
ncbi:hypothetical protein [Chengkuizengella axinellae]|uniref:Lipopolysaccharide assembly protein A domain-containing protein n=1 Tax=Chengkuizengella axinellae TaxID=3064388 RepID=A0ABT9IYK0_9BACL|nr:hypothetical protein [Chengkuizengella sp. 2205SS18-9]MDP5273885.1 hypothetical protein [Chengkuizengella sp. 2205SS18-9]